MRFHLLQDFFVASEEENLVDQCALVPLRKRHVEEVGDEIEPVDAEDNPDVGPDAEDGEIEEQLHKLELSAGSCVRLNNGGMKSKEAGPGTDSVQLQVEKLSLASSNFYPDWELIHDI